MVYDGVDWTRSMARDGDEEQAAEEAAERAHREKEAGAAGDPAGAAGTEAAAGSGAVDVGMVEQVLAPGVEDGEEAEGGAEVFGVAADGEEGFGGGTEKDAVNLARVLQGDLGDLLGAR
jgi:hypothetical protein